MQLHIKIAFRLRLYVNAYKFYNQFAIRESRIGVIANILKYMQQGVLLDL